MIISFLRKKKKAFLSESLLLNIVFCTKKTCGFAFFLACFFALSRTPFGAQHYASEKVYFPGETVSVLPAKVTSVSTGVSTVRTPLARS